MPAFRGRSLSSTATPTRSRLSSPRSKPWACRVWPRTGIRSSGSTDGPLSTWSRLRLATDASAGDWVVRGVGPFGSGVGALVPHGFEAYERILHPALAAYDRPVSWATGAEA